MNHYSLIRPTAILISVGFFMSLPPAYSQQELATKPIRLYGTDRFRAESAITHGVISSDGITLFTLGNNSVTRWNLVTGEGKQLLSDSRLRNALSLSLDGKRIASVSENSVAIWDALTGKEIKRFDESDSAGFVAFRPNSESLLIHRKSRIEVRRLRGGQWDIFQAEEYVTPALAPDLSYFALPSRRGQIAVVDSRSLEVKAVLPVGDFGISETSNGLRKLLMAFSPDKKTVATKPDEGDGPLIWDLKKAEIAKKLRPADWAIRKHETEYTEMLFSKDGRLLFAGSTGGTIRRWDIAGEIELSPLRSGSSRINGLFLAKEGSWLVSVDDDGIIRRWNVASGTEIPLPDGYFGSLDFRFSTAGDNVVLLDRRGRIDRLHVESGKILTKIRTQFTNSKETMIGSSFGYMPDGNRIYFADRDERSITIWNATDGKAETKLTFGNMKFLRACIPSPDGRAFIVNFGQNILVRINSKTGEIEWTADKLYNKGIISSTAFADDGKTLICCGNELLTDIQAIGYEFLILDALSGKLLQRKRANTKSELRDDVPNRLYVSNDRKKAILDYFLDLLVVYDSKTLMPIQRFSHFTGFHAISPDGSIVILAGFHGLEGYDTDSRKSLFKPRSIGQVSGIYISPDNRHFITSAGNGTAKLWRLPQKDKMGNKR